MLGRTELLQVLGADRAGEALLEKLIGARLLNASRKVSKLLMSTFAAAESCPTHWLKTAGELTVNALSGRKAGSIFVRDPNGFLIELIQRP